MNLKNETFLHFVDSFLCLFLCYPMMVFYWRGIWDLWGVYIDPQPYPAPKWHILGISATAFAGYFISPLLQKHLDHNNKVQYAIATRCFMYVYAAIYMGFWRSLWETLDYYFPTDLISSLINLLCTYIPLLLVRCSRSCIFPPMFVSLDTREGAISPSTRFSVKPYSENFFLDCLLTHFLVLGLVISSWRGLWNFEHAFIYPDDVKYADHFCLALGYILCITLYILEEPLAHGALVFEKKGFWYKVVYEDVCYFIIFALHGVLWRGAWNCTVRYVFPDPEVGGWFCFIIGSIGLMLLQNFSYVGAMGCAVDGEDPGRGAFYPSRYLRYYILDQDPRYPDRSAENGNGASTANNQVHPVEIDKKSEYGNGTSNGVFTVDASGHDNAAFVVEETKEQTEQNKSVHL